MKKIKINILVIIVLAFIANQLFAQEPIITSDPNPNPTYTTYEEYMQNHPFESTEYVEVSRNFSNKRNGGYLIIVELDLYPDINNAISIYQEDLAEENYNSYVVCFAGTSHIDLRSLIAFYYQTEDIVGAVLVGDLPVAWYELYNTELAIPIWEEFPIDHFFSDIDGIWLDGDDNDIYDEHEGNMQPEISIGRIKADDMSLLSSSEADLINSYFQKNHTFRNEIIETNNALLYVDDDWENYVPSYQSAIEELYPDIDTISEPEQTTVSDYSNNRLLSDYCFIQVHSHASSDKQVFYRNGGTFEEYFNNYSLASLSPTAHFYNLFACSNCRFIESNYMGGIYLLGNDSCRGVIGSTKIGSMLHFEDFYEPLSNDETLGEAFQQWWIQNVDNNNYQIEYKRIWFYGLCILGDPSLKISYNDKIYGLVDLSSGNGFLENTSIHFHNSENDFTINPLQDGSYFYFFTANTFGIYDITYELFSAEGDYYPITIEDYGITINTTTLPNVTLHTIYDPTNVLVSSNESIPAFRRIQEGLNYIMYKQIDGTVNILPGLYTGNGNRYLHWDTDISHIKVHGINQDDCIIDGGNGGNIFGPYGTNCNENDIIENLTIRNCSTAIQNSNGVSIIRNNKFENCGIAIANLSPIKIQNNMFVNNNSCLWSYQEENLSSDFSEIEENVFMQNTSTSPLLYIEEMGYINIRNNTFLNNTLDSEYDCEGSVIEFHSTDDNRFVEIEGNVFQNNIDVNNSSDGILYIDNYYGNCINLSNNDFIENSAVAMINYPTLYTPYTPITNYNSIFKSNTIYGDNVINGEYLYCDYSLFFENNADNGNYNFGDNILSEVDPFLGLNNIPLWNSTTKSPCIDTGIYTDPDGTPADIGALPAVTHKYDIIDLPSPEEDNGWKWLSFPALDTVLNNADIAENVLADILDPTILDKVETEGNDFDIEYSYPSWSNIYQQFTSPQGYKFHMNEAINLDVPGFKVADNTTIALEGNNVENWVGYWLDETQHVSDAFSDYWSGSNINFIQHQYWTAFYLGRWRIMLYEGCDEPTLSYGDMVIVKCNTTINNFQWESGTPVERIVFAETEYFTFEEQADYTPLYIELDSSNMPQEIGAFVNGECIGATVVGDTLIQINAYTTSVPPDNIELELYYGNRNENKHLSTYNCVTSSNPNIVLTHLSTKKIDDAWFIDLREDSSMVPAPTKVSLSNYPNPFNPSTTISYSLPQEGKVSLKIYNVKGQLVKQLIDGSQPEGYYEVVWNGKDNAGRSVASGIYYYRINACGKTINKKMLLLK